MAAPSSYAPPPPAFQDDPSLDLVTAADALFETLFPLLDRDGSGFAAEVDVLGALRCTCRTDDLARRALARVTESGHVDPPRLREIVEGQVPMRENDTGASWHERLVKLVLAIVRDFEKRATERGEFVASAESREVARHLREMEQRRAYATLEALKKSQHEGLRKGQVKEARDFNRSWTVRMAEFNKHARRAVTELRSRHETAIEEYVAAQRPVLVAKLQRTHKATDTLDAQKVLARLSLAEQFDEAGKYARKVDQLQRRDADEAHSLADVELEKKLDVMRWQHKLELRGLLTKISRLRSEHRGAWEEGLSRLVLAQRNMLSTLDMKQQREAKRTAAAVRSMLTPLLTERPENKVTVRSNFALLSPRGGVHRSAAPGGPQPPHAPPPPLQRPSRMVSSAVSARGATASDRHGMSAVTPKTYLATNELPPPSPKTEWPPRPYTSQHVPTESQPSSPRTFTPRPLSQR